MKPCIDFGNEFSKLNCKVKKFELFFHQAKKIPHGAALKCKKQKGNLCVTRQH